MSIDQDIANSSKILEQDVQINHEITHGNDTTEVPTEGGPVPTIAKRLKDIETEWSQQADPLARELADTVEITKGYKTEAAGSASAASASADKASEDARAVSDDKEKVAEDKAAVAQDKTHVDQQVIHVDQQVKQAETHAESAGQSVKEAEDILTTITTGLIPMATNLIRTQSIVIERHGFN